MSAVPSPPSSMQLTFGLEVEAISGVEPPATGQISRFELVRGIAERVGSPAFNSTFEVGTDVSPSQGRRDCLGVEFRTKILWNTFPTIGVLGLIELTPVLQLNVTKTSGIHYHFSGVDLTPREEQELNDRLKKTKIWRSRAGWCLGDGKYTPLRKVRPGHYEARVFNGSLSYQGIYRPWLFLVRAIESVTATKSP